MLQSLLLDRFTGETEAINALIKSIETVRSDRNRILHWLWGKSEGADSVMLVKLPLFDDDNLSMDMTAAEVQRVADDCLNAFVELGRWIDRASERAKATLQPFDALL